MRGVRRGLISAVLTVVTVLTGFVEARAYSLLGFRYKASEMPLVYRINQAGSADVKDGRDFQAIRDAFQVWEDEPGAYIQFEDGGLTSSRSPSSSARIIVYWQERGFPWGSSVLAVAHSRWSPTSPMMSWITFNGANHRWTSYNQTLGVGIHEIGHAIGLGHSGSRSSIMFPMYLGGTKLGADDIAGVRRLYPQTAVDAGDDQTVRAGVWVTLDGSRSMANSYLWDQLQGPHVALQDNTTSRPRFYASTPGQYIFELSADQGRGFVNDTVMVTVYDKNTSLTVNAAGGPSQGGYPPANMVDGNAATVWIGATQRNQYQLDFDLGGVKMLEEVRIDYFHINTVPETLRVSVSDRDGVFQEVGVVPSTDPTRLIVNRRASKVRFNLGRTASNANVSIAEVTFKVRPIEPDPIPLIETRSDRVALRGTDYGVDARVTNPDGLRSVTLEYVVLNGTEKGIFKKIPMTRTGDNDYTANVPAVDLNRGFLLYRVRAESNRSVLATSGVREVTIFTPPVMDYTPPLSAKPFESFTVTAGISDNDGYVRGEVVVETARGETEVYGMMGIDNGEYQVTIPGEKVVPGVLRFQVKAEDMLGAVARLPHDGFFSVPVSEDRTPPRLDPTPVPDFQPTDQPIKFRTKIEDESDRIEAYLVYRAGAGELRERLSFGDSYWAVVLQADSVAADSIVYRFEASDPSGNRTITDAVTLQLRDRTPPVILHTVPSRPVPAGNPVSIEGSVQDNDTVVSLSILYRSEPGPYREEVLPIPEFKKTFDSSVLASLSLEYFLVSRDASGNEAMLGSERNPLTVLFVDNIPPVIRHEVAAPGLTPRVQTRIAAVIEDISDLRRTEIRMLTPDGERILEMFPDGGEYVTVIPASFVLPELIAYKIVAEDSFGNRSEREYRAKVEPDTIAPVIVHQVPGAIFPGFDYPIYVSAEDNIGMGAVVLFIKHVSDTGFSRFEMTDAGNGKFSGRVPAALARAGSVVYYFEAVDRYGNTTRSENYDLLVEQGITIDNGLGEEGGFYQPSSRKLYMRDPNNPDSYIVMEFETIDELKHFVLSRDGEQVIAQGDSFLYLIRADGAEPVQITTEPYPELFPAFSPDGKYVIYAALKDGNWDIFMKEIDGDGDGRPDSLGKTIRLTEDAVKEGYTGLTPLTHIAAPEDETVYYPARDEDFTLSGSAFATLKTERVSLVPIQSYRVLVEKGRQFTGSPYRTFDPVFPDRMIFDETIMNFRVEDFSPGWHTIRLEGRAEPGNVGFDDVRIYIPGLELTGTVIPRVVPSGGMFNIEGEVTLVENGPATAAPVRVSSPEEPKFSGEVLADRTGSYGFTFTAPEVVSVTPYSMNVRAEKDGLEASIALVVIVVPPGLDPDIVENTPDTEVFSPREPGPDVALPPDLDDTSSPGGDLPPGDKGVFSRKIIVELTPTDDQECFPGETEGLSIRAWYADDSSPVANASFVVRDLKAKVNFSSIGPMNHSGTPFHLDENGTAWQMFPCVGEYLTQQGIHMLRVTVADWKSSRLTWHPNSRTSRIPGFYMAGNVGVDYCTVLVKRKEEPGPDHSPDGPGRPVVIIAEPVWDTGFSCGTMLVSGIVRYDNGDPFSPDRVWIRREGTNSTRLARLTQTGFLFEGDLPSEPGTYKYNVVGIKGKITVETEVYRTVVSYDLEVEAQGTPEVYPDETVNIRVKARRSNGIPLSRGIRCDVSGPLLPEPLTTGREDDDWALFSFTAPDRPGTHILTVTVDDFCVSAKKTVSVHIEDYEIPVEFDIAETTVAPSLYVGSIFIPRYMSGKTRAWIKKRDLVPATGAKYKIYYFRPGSSDKKLILSGRLDDDGSWQGDLQTPEQGGTYVIMCEVTDGLRTGTDTDVVYVIPPPPTTGKYECDLELSIDPGAVWAGKEAKLRGFVYDSISGLPLPFQKVRVQVPSRKTVDLASDREGRFVYNFVAPRRPDTYYCRAWLDLGGERCEKEVELVTFRSELELVPMVQPRALKGGQQAEGLVRVYLDGVPLSRQSVRVTDPSLNLDRVLVTDDEGDLRFSVPPLQNDRHKLTFTTEKLVKGRLLTDRAYVVLRKFDISNRVEAQPGELVPSAAVTVIGRALYTTGSPVSRGKVEITYPGGRAELNTDENGDYAFTFAAPDRPGAYEIVSVASDGEISAAAADAFRVILPIPHPYDPPGNKSPAPIDEVHPVFSPDGKWIAYASNQSGNFDIWVMSAADYGERYQVTTSGAKEIYPAWSPDGKYLSYTSDLTGNLDIFARVVDSDGDGLPDSGGREWQITFDQGEDNRSSWSPDGLLVGFHSTRSGNLDIWYKNADGSGSATRVTKSPYADAHPQWSPDGQRFVFHSNRPGDIFGHSEGDRVTGIQFLLDRSGSMTEEKIEQVTAALARFVDNVNPRHKLGALAFTKQEDRILVRELAGLSTDRQVFKRAVAENYQPSYGSTPMKSAIYSAIPVLASSVDRPIMVVLSDGEDNASVHSARQVIEYARAHNVIIFGIFPGQNPPAEFVEICEQSGGKLFQVPDYTALGEVLAGINGEIRRQVENFNIWTVRIDGTGLEQLTDHPADDLFPAWSFDMTKIAFVSFRTGRGDIYIIDYLKPAFGDAPEARIDILSVVDREATLTAQNSRDPDGDELAYHWDFGDGTEAEGENVSHTFEKDGEQKVVLTVTDAVGYTDRTEAIIRVPNQPPVADLDLNVEGNRVTIDASGSYDEDSDPISFEIYLGDNNISHDSVLTHTYQLDGVYKITLFVRDPFGREDRIVKSVNIATGLPDLAIKEYYWDFGDAKITKEVISPSGLDVMLDVSKTPNTELYAGQKVPLTAVITNIGTANSPPTEVWFGMSVWGFNQRWDKVAITTIEGLAPGEEQTVVIEYNIGQGNNTEVWVDWYRKVPELNEKNNHRSRCLHNVKLPPKSVRIDTSEFGHYEVKIPVRNPKDSAETYTVNPDPVSIPVGWRVRVIDGKKVLEPNDVEDVVLVVDVDPDVSDSAVIRVIAVDSEGETAEVFVQFEPFAEPIARIEGPEEGTPLQLLRFDGNGSSDKDGELESYIWDFGDGSGTVVGPVAEHSFADEGEYIVTLRVKDNLGLTDADTLVVRIERPRCDGPVVLEPTAAGLDVQHLADVPLPGGSALAQISVDRDNRVIVSLPDDDGYGIYTIDTRGYVGMIRSDKKTDEGVYGVGITAEGKIVAVLADRQQGNVRVVKLDREQRIELSEGVSGSRPADLVLAGDETVVTLLKTSESGGGRDSLVRIRQGTEGILTGNSSIVPLSAPELSAFHDLALDRDGNVYTVYNGTGDGHYRYGDLVKVSTDGRTGIVLNLFDRFGERVPTGRRDGIRGIALDIYGMTGDEPAIVFFNGHTREIRAVGLDGQYPRVLASVRDGEFDPLSVDLAFDRGGCLVVAVGCRVFKLCGQVERSEEEPPEFTDAEEFFITVGEQQEEYLFSPAVIDGRKDSIIVGVRLEGTLPDGYKVRVEDIVREEPVSLLELEESRIIWSGRIHLDADREENWEYDNARDAIANTGRYRLILENPDIQNRMRISRIKDIFTPAAAYLDASGDIVIGHAIPNRDLDLLVRDTGDMKKLKVEFPGGYGVRGVAMMPDGKVAILRRSLESSDGDIVVVDAGGRTVREIPITQGHSATDLASDSSGNLYTLVELIGNGGSRDSVLKISPEGNYKLVLVGQEDRSQVDDLAVTGDGRVFVIFHSDRNRNKFDYGDLVEVDVESERAVKVGNIFTGKHSDKAGYLRGLDVLGSRAVTVNTLTGEVIEFDIATGNSRVLDRLNPVENFAVDVGYDRAGCLIVYVSGNVYKYCQEEDPRDNDEILEVEVDNILPEADIEERFGSGNDRELVLTARDRSYSDAGSAEPQDLNFASAVLSLDYEDLSEPRTVEVFDRPLDKETVMVNGDSIPFDTPFFYLLTVSDRAGNRNVVRLQGMTTVPGLGDTEPLPSPEPEAGVWVAELVRHDLGIDTERVRIAVHSRGASHDLSHALLVFGRGEEYRKGVLPTVVTDPAYPVSSGRDGSTGYSGIKIDETEISSDGSETLFIEFVVDYGSLDTFTVVMKSGRQLDISSITLDHPIYHPAPSGTAAVDLAVVDYYWDFGDAKIEGDQRGRILRLNRLSPQEIFVGYEARLTALVKNLGDVPAENIEAHFRAGAWGFNRGWRTVGDTLIPRLDPGETRRVVFTHRLGKNNNTDVIVDRGRKIRDRNRRNNRKHLCLWHVPLPPVGMKVDPVDIGTVEVKIPLENTGDEGKRFKVKVDPATVPAGLDVQIENPDIFVPPGEVLDVVLKGVLTGDHSESAAVRVVAGDEQGETSLVVVRFAPVLPPVAVIDTPETVQVGEQLEIRADRSWDRDGEITTYKWIIGNVRLEGPIVERRFSEPGEIRIVLVVEDNLGLTDTAVTYVLVEDSLVVVAGETGNPEAVDTGTGKEEMTDSDVETVLEQVDESGWAVRLEEVETVDEVKRVSVSVRSESARHDLSHMLLIFELDDEVLDAVAASVNQNHDFPVSSGRDGSTGYRGVKIDQTVIPADGSDSLVVTVSLPKDYSDTFAVVTKSGQDVGYTEFELQVDRAAMPDREDKNERQIEGKAKFDIYNLDVCPGDTFKLTDYVKVEGDYRLGREFRFEYEDGTDWHIDAFNADRVVTVTKEDESLGNHGKGEYRVSIRDIVENKLVDHLTVRVGKTCDLDEQKDGGTEEDVEDTAATRKKRIRSVEDVRRHFPNPKKLREVITERKSPDEEVEVEHEDETGKEKVKVKIRKNTLKRAFYLVVRDVDEGRLEEADRKLREKRRRLTRRERKRMYLSRKRDREETKTERKDYIKEFLLIDEESGTEIHDGFNEPIEISFTYSENDLPPGAAEKDLSIYWLNPENDEWEPVESIVDEEKNTVSAAVTHFSIYGLLSFTETGPISGFSDLAQMRVYPNPYRSDRYSFGYVTFDNLPPATTIEIFTLLGERVAEFRTSNQSVVRWTLTNHANRRVASGMYLYLVRSPDGSRRRGKLTVIW